LFYVRYKILVLLFSGIAFVLDMIDVNSTSLQIQSVSYRMNQSAIYVAS
jgi:hypothetical protein